MSVDVSKIKVGDDVAVRLRVFAVDGPSLRLGRDEEDAWAWARDWDIVSHTPREPKVGDQVRTKRTQSFGVGVVLAVSKSSAWVNFPCNDRPTTVMICDLERVDE